MFFKEISKRWPQMLEKSPDREIHVFVCYSHLDRKWVDGADVGLIPWLQKQLRGEGVTLWWDHGIKVGETYERSIFDRIDKADIAILLVSDDFAASDYINEKEAPRIRSRHAKGTLAVMPLLVAPMSGLNHKRLEWITENIQMLPRDPRGLASALYNPLEWAELRAKILDELHHSVETLRSGLIPVATDLITDQTGAIQSVISPDLVRVVTLTPSPEVLKISGKALVQGERPILGAEKNSTKPQSLRTAVFTVIGAILLISGGWLGPKWLNRTNDYEDGYGLDKPLLNHVGDGVAPPNSPSSSTQGVSARRGFTAGEFIMIPGGVFRLEIQWARMRMLQ